MRPSLQHRAQTYYRSSLRQWLRSNPRTLRFLRRSGCFGTDPRAVSIGVGIGLFFALTPTVGIQTIMILLCCVAFRASFAVAYGASWVSNPFTVAPLYLGFNYLGDRIMGVKASIVSHGGVVAEAMSEELLQMLVGSLLVAIPVALGMAWLVFWRMTRMPPQ